MIVVTIEGHEGNKIGELQLTNLNMYSQRKLYNYVAEFKDPRETPFRTSGRATITDHDREQSIWGLVSKALDFCTEKTKPFNVAAAGGYIPPDHFMMRAELWPDGDRSEAKEIGHIFFCREPKSPTYSYTILDPLTSDFSLKGDGIVTFDKPDVSLWKAAQRALRDMEEKGLLPKIAHRPDRQPPAGLFHRVRELFA